MGSVFLLSLSPFLVSHLLLLLFRPESAGADLQSDALALQQFLVAVYQGNNLNWSDPSMVCSWKGVTCTGPNVTALRLPGSNLAGGIPLGVFSNLRALTHISLRSNHLTGAFPPELSLCTALRSLTLSSNRFSGSLPGSPATTWPSLQRFDVSVNAFNGSLPLWLPQSTRLNVLLLQNNSFEGPIPAGIWQNLSDFSVANNNLSGGIPLKLQLFPADSFAGNGYLCGPPLLQTCPLAPPLLAPAAPPSSTPLMQPPSSTPSPTASQPTAQSSKRLSVGAIVGIAIGALAVAVLICVLFFCWCFSRCDARREPQESSAVAAAGTSGWVPLQVSMAARSPQVAATTVTNVAGKQSVAVVPGGDSQFDSRSQQSKSSGNNSKISTLAQSAAAAASSTSASQSIEKLVILEGPPFEIEDLLRASAEVLGKGSMGTAFKATLDLDPETEPDPRRNLMVKRVNLSIASPQFVELIDTIHKMRHDNLLPLLAYQHGEKSFLLIYQYTDMGNLRTLLHGLNGAKTLSLENRCKIALNVARALAYLHSHVTTTPIFKCIHGDVKSSNVLLKSDGSVYLSDFGLTHMVAATMAPCKMLGYRSPEVLELRRVTPKSDVYSFGVLLLELLTGNSPEVEPPTAGSDSSSSNDLPWLVRERLSRGNGPVEVFNSDLLYSAGKDKAKTMEHLLDVAMVCTEPFPNQRPTMVQVVFDLMSICGLDESNQLISVDYKDSNGFEEEYDDSGLV